MIFYVRILLQEKLLIQQKHTCKKCKNPFSPQKGLLSYCSLACRNSRTFSTTSRTKTSLSLKRYFTESDPSDISVWKNNVILGVSNFNKNKTRRIKTNNLIANKPWSELSFNQKKKQVILDQHNSCFSCRDAGDEASLYINFSDQNRDNFTRDNLTAHCHSCYRSILMANRALRSKKIICSYEMMIKNGKTLSCFDAKHPEEERKWAFLEDAVAWIKAAGIESKDEWIKYSRNKKLKNNIPLNIPKDIQSAYKPAFEKFGWPIIFGRVGRYSKKFLPYEEAQVWAKNLNIKSSNDWFDYRKKHKEKIPDTIPSNPSRIYKDWKFRGGWNGFLLNSSSLKNSFSSIELCLKKIFNEIFQSKDDILIVKGPKGGRMPLDMVSHKHKLALDYDGF